MSHKICKLAGIATRTLDKSIAAIVAASALEQYSRVVALVNAQTGIDINEFFAYIALLAVLCWVGQWLNEIMAFTIVTIPRFFKNLCHGKFSMCLLDCDKSHKSSESTKSSRTASTKSTSTHY
jgi:Na+/glutamate symporter